MKIINTAVWITVLGVTTYYSYRVSNKYKDNIENSSNVEKIKWLGLTGLIGYATYLTAVEVRTNIIEGKSPISFVEEKTHAKENSLIKELEK